MKPKVSKLGSSETSMKIVRFAATPSLVDQDLTSLVEICNKSQFHSGNWKAQKSAIEECTEENIYSELKLKGLKINNQR